MMKRCFLNIKSIKFILILLAVVLLMFNRGFAIEPESLNRARIKPTIVNLKPGNQQQFYIVKESIRLTAAYATKKVTWYVNDIAGGNKTIGTISTEGLYQAPNQTPGSSEIHISASINTTSNKLLWATVLLNGERPVYQTVMVWGELKDSLKHFKEPKAIVKEADGNILIADGTVKRFSGNGKFINEIGEHTREYVGSIEDPVNLALDFEGNIFVIDKNTGQPRIKVYSKDGHYIYGFAPKGTSPERVMDTQGAAFNSKQQLFVGDFDNRRVSEFEHSGEFIRTIGKSGTFPGEINLPHGIAVDANDDLFVINHFGPCQKFTPDGHFLRAFSYANPPEGLAYLTDVATDGWGNVYLIAKGAQKTYGEYEVLKDEQEKRFEIIKFNNNGDFIAHIQLSKANRNALRLMVDDYGKIYVLFADKEMIGVEVLEQ